MANFTPVSAAIGGALIGLAAVLLMLFTGRIAGISGIFGGCLDLEQRRQGLAHRFHRRADPGAARRRPGAAFRCRCRRCRRAGVVIVAAGLLVGFGTRLGGGCTSGHGVCGIARLSPRSIAATAIFMAVAVAVVALTRHVLGG